MLAVPAEGLLHLIPGSLEDEHAKNDFANVGWLIGAAYGATNMGMILESWVTMAKPGQTLDTETPPSEAFDREEFVVVMGDVRAKTQLFLPILRTDACGFFGFGDFDAMKLDVIALEWA